VSLSNVCVRVCMFTRLCVCVCVWHVGESHVSWSCTHAFMYTRMHVHTHPCTHAFVRHYISTNCLTIPLLRHRLVCNTHAPPARSPPCTCSSNWHLQQHWRTQQQDVMSGRGAPSRTCSCLHPLLLQQLHKAPCSHTPLPLPPPLPITSM